MGGGEGGGVAGPGAYIYIFFSFLLLGFTVLSLHVRCIPHQ